MSYKKELQMKVTRTIHVIDIFEGSRACDIKTYLSKVPDGAIILSVEEDGIVAGKYYIKFEEEEIENA